MTNKNILLSLRCLICIDYKIYNFIIAIVLSEINALKFDFSWSVDKTRTRTCLMSAIQTKKSPPYSEHGRPKVAIRETINLTFYYK